MGSNLAIISFLKMLRKLISDLYFTFEHRIFPCALISVTSPIYFVFLKSSSKSKYFIAAVFFFLATLCSIHGLFLTG